MSKQKAGVEWEKYVRPAITVGVIGATVGVPLAAWIANRFFDWQVPAFLQPVIDFFHA